MPRSGGGHPERRGQVILVAAIGIALALLAMGMVLGAVAVPQQWWSAENVNSVQSVTTTDSMVEGYGSAMFHTNFDNCLGVANLRAEYRTTGGRWRSWFARLENQNGNTVNATVQHATIGAIVKQRHHSTFTNKSDAGNWTPVNETNVRRFTMNVSKESLVNVSTVTASNLESSQAFAVTLNGTKTRHIYIYRTDADAIGIAVVNDSSDTVTNTYSVDQSSTVIDVTESRIAAEPRSGFPNVTPPYGISFSNGDAAKGRYLFVVETNESDIENVTQNFHDKCGRNTPCTERAIYSAQVQFATHTSRLAYETTTTVAPEDPGLRFGGCEIQHRVTFVNKANQTLSTVTTTPNATEYVHLDSKVQTMGSAQHDVNGAGGIDIPYTLDGKLYFVDIASGEGRQIDSKAETQPLAVGDLDGDGKDAFYYNRNQNIYKITPSGSKVLVKKSGNLTAQPTALGGIADFDGDGSQELVFRNNNADIVYLESDGTEVVLSYAEVNKEHAIGRPADFDGDGTAMVPVVKNKEIWLLSHESNVWKRPNTSFTDVSPEPVAPADIDHDLELEIVFSHADNGGLYYMEISGPDNGTVHPVTDTDGDAIDANKNKGAK